jgi:hypothetical protein
VTTIGVATFLGVVAWSIFLIHEKCHQDALKDAMRAYGRAYVAWRDSDHHGAPPVIPDILGGPRPGPRGLTLSGPFFVPKHRLEAPDLGPCYVAFAVPRSQRVRMVPIPSPLPSVYSKAA